MLLELADIADEGKRLPTAEGNTVQTMVLEGQQAVCRISNPTFPTCYIWFCVATSLCFLTRKESMVICSREIRFLVNMEGNKGKERCIDYLPAG